MKITRKDQDGVIGFTVDGSNTITLYCNEGNPISITLNYNPVVISAGDEAGLNGTGIQVNNFEVLYVNKAVVMALKSLIEAEISMARMEISNVGDDNG